MIFLIFDTPEERDKFTKLYKIYKKTIYYTINRFFIDDTILEDISHDIYLILAKHLDDIDLDNYKKTQNYIITITRNYCKNYLRNQSKEHVIPLEQIQDIPDAKDSLLDDLITKEEFQTLVKTIHSLDDIYKSVLELKYINEFSNDEIANFLNIKKKTVEMRLYRANSLLRSKLKEFKKL